jgi:hypothetical protein
MYGPNYVIEPYYVHTPIIFVYFRGPRYRPWISPYHWGYYPAYYAAWRPYPVHVYHHHVHVHVHGHYGHTYGYVGYRRSSAAMAMHRNVQRNDYAAQHPERTFAKRNAGVENKRQLMDSRHPDSGAGMSADGRGRQQVRPAQGNVTPAGNRQQHTDLNNQVISRSPEAAGRQVVQQPTRQAASPQRTPATERGRTNAVRPEQQSGTIAAPRPDQRQTQPQRQPERQTTAPTQRPAPQRQSAVTGSAPQRIERQQPPASRGANTSTPSRSGKTEAGPRARN